MQTKNIIRNVYLYLVSAIALFMVVFAVVSLVNLGLRTWIFPKADDNYYSQPSKPVAEMAAQIEQDRQNAENNKLAQRQRDLVQNISFLIVAGPLFAFHWRLIRKDHLINNA